MPRDRTCRATRRDGSPCTSTIVLPSGLCHMHDPDRRASVATARAKGGQGRRRTARVQRLMPATLRPVLVRLLDALDQTHEGELDPKVAGALAALAGAICKVYQQGQL